MTDKHTPGPWHTEYTGHNDLDGDFDIETAIIRNDHIVVAEVEVHDASVADFEANARLIAAAPELLAALREIADDHCECEGPNEFHDGQQCRFHAAIAKATA